MTDLVRLIPDARMGALYSVEVTMGVATSVIEVAVPNQCNGFRLYSDGEIRFAIGQDPTADGAQSDDVTLAELGVGGYVFASAWEVRVLPEGVDRTLHLYAVTGAETVNVEFF